MTIAIRPDRIDRGPGSTAAGTARRPGFAPDGAPTGPHAVPSQSSESSLDPSRSTHPADEVGGASYGGTLRTRALHELQRIDRLIADAGGGQATSGAGGASPELARLHLRRRSLIAAVSRLA